MSRVLSVRLHDRQFERLKALARRGGRSAGEVAARFIEESLRVSEFGGIEFRDSIVGRQAHIQGTSLAVWEVVFVARSYDGKADATARHLNWSVVPVQAALNYAAAFPDEIEAALTDNDSYDFEKVARMLPQARLFTVQDSQELPEEPVGATSAPR